MPEGRDSHDGSPASASADGDRDAESAPRTDPSDDGIGGVDPLRFAVLGASTFGALAAGWILTTLVFAGFSDPVTLEEGPFGMTMRQPDDLYLAVSGTYGLLVQVGPLLGVLLGLVVGWSVDTRTPAGVAGAAAVTAGAAVALFVLALLDVLLHPRGGSVDVLDLLEPAFASVLGTAVACIGGATAFGVFEALEGP